MHTRTKILTALVLTGSGLAAWLLATSDPAPKSSSASVGGRRAGIESAGSPDHEHTNRLVDETSPYLLQHAHNPVDWHPWGEEALARAKREDKPIFLSVGYSTCYWCHVMERESFENEEVAAILNEHYVAIKVDREERPDVDEQYMIATQLVTGRGGWPNSVWLTPDGRPWMAGTYFPRARFMKVLRQLAEVWRTRRAEVEQQADRMAGTIRTIGSGSQIQAGPELSRQLVDDAVGTLRVSFDKRNAGFGRAPKFPPHASLRLIVHEYRRTKDPALLDMVGRTLDAMALGGMHDHVGGGFHRYATDAHWLLPHFEKMLYDNAQLVRAYTDGALLRGEDRDRRVVEDVFRWVRREMTGPHGAFFSAIDSESEAEEGKFYVWRREEVLEVLGEKRGALFADVYGFREGGNFREERTGETTGANIPHLDEPLSALAKERGEDPDRFRAKLAKMRADLLKARSTRVRPHLDDKVLAGWNGLMIEGLAYAGRHLDEPRYVSAAARAATFILDHMVDGGRLFRVYREGETKQPAYLDDHAYLAAGLLELHAATGEARWLDAARSLADRMLDEFEDKKNGAFFLTTARHEDMLLRSKSLLGGGNVPSPNGVAAIVLLRLGEVTGEDRYGDAARRTLEALSGLTARGERQAEDLVLATALLLEEREERVPAKVDTLPAERGGQDVLGKKMPELEFDRVVAGSARKKGAVTLYRWWTDTCPYCEASLPALERLREKYAGRGLRVVGVYHPKPPRPVPDDEIRAAARAAGFGGAIVVDRDWSELKRFYLGAGSRRATSASFLVDREGVIRFVHPGPDLYPSDDPKLARQNEDFRMLERAIDVLLPSGRDGR